HQNAPETYAAFWSERMQGGMDEAIISGFADVTHAAASGQLDHWTETPRGRLALIIALDRFPRSLWRNTPAAYAQDIQAARLALAGVANGHFASLQPWEMMFFYIAIAHCEGPDHLARMHMLDDAVELVIKKLPDQLCESGPQQRAQHQKVKKTIASYGRHSHRNDILSRQSTREGEIYISAGDFPHRAKRGP
ncbi:MAG: DUF924 domain-containing protein, partial [Octadecabacter sp.]|nr:DUF924 domain-containing protein [Octadecabacter sp.]